MIEVKSLDETEKVISREVNNNPELFSLLYDLDLLPEQVKKPSKDWQRLMILGAYILKIKII